MSSVSLSRRHTSSRGPRGSWHLRLGVSVISVIPNHCRPISRKSLSVFFFFFPLLGLTPLSFDPGSNNKPLQLGSAAGPRVSESPAENGGDPGKKRKRGSIPAGEHMELGGWQQRERLRNQLLC